MRKVVSRLALSVLVLLLVSCPSADQTGPTPPNSSGGSLVIHLALIPMQSSDGKEAPSSTAVFSYDVLGSGPAKKGFQERGVFASTVTVDSLDPGDWGVTVNGNNFSGIQVASASFQVTIVEGETASADIAVGSSAGDGTLDVYLEWPQDKPVFSPTVALTPQGEAPHEITLPAVVTENGFSSLHAATGLAAGYYTLSVSYTDDAGFTWGGAEAVRLSLGSTTRLIFRPFETVKMTVVPDISKALPIDLSALKPKIVQGEKVSVTATLTQLTSDKFTSYRWYLNGIPQPETTATISYPGKAIPAGDYRLDVAVGTQGVLASNHVLFTIAGN